MNNHNSTFQKGHGLNSFSTTCCQEVRTAPLKSDTSSKEPRVNCQNNVWKCFLILFLFRYQRESEHRSAAQPDHGLRLHPRGKVKMYLQLKQTNTGHFVLLQSEDYLFFISTLIIGLIISINITFHLHCPLLWSQNRNTLKKGSKGKFCL